jgi:hypothetical protein
VPPDRREDLQMLLAQVRRGVRLEPFETIRVHKDGTRLDVALTVSPMTTSEGASWGPPSLRGT